MLGTGLGKKVDANFVKNAYNSFLRKEDPTPPRRPKTQEERREECRKKGIFVAADDVELEPTTFEQPATGSRPANFKNDPKPLKWKKVSTVNAKNRKPEVKPSQTSFHEQVTPTKKAVTPPGIVKASREKRKRGEKKRNPSEETVEMPAGKPLQSEPSTESMKFKAEEKKSPVLPQLAAPEPKSDRDSQPKSPKLNKRKEHSDQSLRKNPPPPGDHVVEDAVALAVAMAVGVKPSEAKKALEPQAEALQSPHHRSGPMGEVDVLAKTPQEHEYTLREPVRSPPTGGARREKDAAFGKLDDDEFEKLLNQENSRCPETDKHAVKAARKILKAAYREKVLDKVLTKEENETLVKFFAGKIPYNQKVLKILDRALDKTIDWMESRKVQVSTETKELIEQRANLKRALFAEFLINPQYLPATWAKKYEELRQQSMLETADINWARVLLCYPTQKSFGDGPMDQFGNFTRGKRHWLLAMIIGPADSKTFIETQREEACKGMYLDSAIMEKAKQAPPKDDDTSVSSSIRE